MKCRYTLYVQAARRFSVAMGKCCECPRKPPNDYLQRLADCIDACARVDSIDEFAFPEEFREWYNIAEDQFANKACIDRERAFRCFASRTHELTFALAGAGLCRFVFAWLLQAEPGRYPVTMQVHATEVVVPKMVRAVDGSTSPVVTPPESPAESDSSNRRGKPDSSASEQTGTPGERDANGGIVRNPSSLGNGSKRRGKPAGHHFDSISARSYYMTRSSLAGAAHLRHGGDSVATADFLTEYTVTTSAEVVAQYMPSEHGSDDIYGIRTYESWIRDIPWQEPDDLDVDNGLVAATVDSNDGLSTSVFAMPTAEEACKFADACYQGFFGSERW